MKDDGLNNIEITGSKISFEIDIQNLGIINTYSAIFCNNIEYYGDAIVPIYIPNVHDIKEIMNDLLTDKCFEYKFISPYIKIKSMERKGFNRYISTNSLVHSLRSHINIDEDDCIYNVAPPKEFTIGKIQYYIIILFMKQMKMAKFLKSLIILSINIFE